MALTKSQSNAIASIAGTCSKMSALILSVAADSVLQSAAVTDTKINSVAGEVSMSPTSNQTQLQQGSVRASDSEGTLSKNETSAQKGSVNANATKADAAEQKANASEAGATALVTEAGASEIATKALKMN